MGVASRFYGRFHVSPEEVGVGFAFLTVRMVFILIIAAGAFGAAWAGLTVLSKRVGLVEMSPRLRRVLESLAISAGGIFVAGLFGPLLTGLPADLFMKLLALMCIPLFVMVFFGEKQTVPRPEQARREEGVPQGFRFDLGRILRVLPGCWRSPQVDCC